MASRPGEIIDLDALVSVHDAVAQGTAPSGLALETEERPVQCLFVQRRAGGLLLALPRGFLSEDQRASERLAGADDLVGPSLEAYTTGQGTDANGFMEEVLVIDYADTIIESISPWTSERCRTSGHSARTWTGQNYAELAAAVQWLSGAVRG